MIDTDYAALLAEHDALVADAERLVAKWRARADDFDGKSADASQTPENRGWAGGMAEATDDCADELKSRIERSAGVNR